MTEKEIREVIRELCEELDRSARRVVRKVVVPAALGAGLALSAGACGDGRTVPGMDTLPHVVDAYGVPFDRPQMLYGLPDATYLDGKVTKPDSAYAMPFERGVNKDLKPKLDMGPIPPYTAPMPDLVPPPQPDYMAPEDGGGAVPLYTMPMPDMKKLPG